MVWPAGSWAFSTLLGDDATRLLACVSYVLTAVGFVVGGAGMLAGQAWWRPAVVGSAALSVIVFVLFWDGGVRKLDQQGGIGLLINFAIVAAVLALRRPEFEI